MPVGISSYLSNKILDHVCRNTAYTPPSTVYARIHTGQPGAAGTSNGSSITTRIATTFAAAAAGQIAMSNTPEFTLSGNETITHVSFWDAATGGNFLWSSQATTAKSGGNGDIIRISTNTLSLGPIAS